MSLAIERIAPYFAAAAWVAIWYFLLCQSFPAEPSGLLASTGTAAAVFVGFLTTANAIVLSLAHTEIFRRLSAAKYTTLFYAYFYEAVAASMGLLIASVVGFFLKEADATSGIFPLIWMTLAAMSLTLFLRINHLLFGLIKQAG